jgi:hypothetical protein
MKLARSAATLALLACAPANAGGLPVAERAPHAPAVVPAPTAAQTSTPAAPQATTPAAPQTTTPPTPAAALPVALGARLPEGDAAAEHWDLAAHFASGHRLYARFLITNAGPGERTALAFGHLLRPDGPPVEFRNGRRAGSWQLSEDRRRIAIGSSVLELGDSAHHFEVDNDKRGIEILLDFAADAGARAAPAGPGGYRLELLNLATPAHARILLAGMPAPERLEGLAVLTHTWFNRDEADLVAQRTDVAGLDPAARIFLTEVLTPGGDRWRWLVAGDSDYRGDADGLVFEAAGARGTGYPIPAALEVRGNDLDGRISLGPTLLEVDPAAALPALLRMVYPFAGKPRHVWVEASADVALKSRSRDAVLRLRGEGIATLVFLDSRPPDLR